MTTPETLARLDAIIDELRQLTTEDYYPVPMWLLRRRIELQDERLVLMRNLSQSDLCHWYAS